MAIHTAGELAYLDSYRGLVPVKVLSVGTYETMSGRIKPLVRVRVTADRPGYSRGDELELGALHVVPREHVVRRNGRYRIIGQWAWLPDQHVDDPAYVL